MIYLVTYIVLCTVLFFCALYAHRLRNDVYIKDLGFLLLFSFVPLFNLVMLSVMYDELRKHSNVFAFLDKIIIKRKQ